MLSRKLFTMSIALTSTILVSCGKESKNSDGPALVTPGIEAMDSKKSTTDKAAPTQATADKGTGDTGTPDKAAADKAAADKAAADKAAADKAAADKAAADKAAEIKMYHKVPSVTELTTLGHLVRFGACYAYSEKNYASWSAEDRKSLKEGTCPSTVESLAPYQATFRSLGECKVAKSADEITVITIYDGVFSNPDNVWVSRVLVNALDQCARLNGEFTPIAQ